MRNTISRFPACRLFHHWLAFALILIAAASLTACGSTKVYTADKTIVYQNAIYNVSNVKVFKPTSEGDVGQGQTVDLIGMDKSKFNALLKAHPSIQVTQAFMLDDQEMVYQKGTVKSWSDLNKMNNRFKDAGQDITKFLADKKKTQLKLK
jgi:hypothetical protein